MENKPTKKPRSNPAFTSASEWRRSNSRLLPTQPAMTSVAQSHHIGLKWKMNEKAMSAPLTAPAAAECVLILYQQFTNAQAICTNSEARTTLTTKWGTISDVST